MGKINKLYVTILFAISLAACGGKKQVGNGLITIIEDREGPEIKEDDFASITYAEKTEDGRLISGSYDYDYRPTLVFREKPYFKGDFFDALGHLTEGDSAIIKISLDSLRKTGHVKDTISTDKYRIYYVRVNEVVARGDLNDSLFNVNIEALKKREAEKAKSAEGSNIRAYMASRKIKSLQRSPGLDYVIVKDGSGTKPSVGDTVIVNYTARTLTGKIFETTLTDSAKKAGIYRASRKYVPSRVPVLSGTQLSGFGEAAGLFPAGTKAMLIIHSSRAYGGGLYRKLQPYTTVICDLEVQRIIPKKIKS
ncbi:FKBP-type peptidyl-prolyl cis-trans isomerase [Pedobacter heparinus]|uniref:FKBP-type peptidyl-prolyl cis-trans isomerase n=1 Tax=Pedobacter heparinus TaxID=984 RepID=UPI00292CC5DC|nr:FKBP-type peptidyl-prolyl cis-trans isomerase [Pedobacter heparinus]